MIRPNWPAPAFIQAAMCLRSDAGRSTGPYAGCNLSDYVGDDPVHVAYNRDLLKQKLGLKNDPMWLTQVHGADVLNIDKLNLDSLNLDKLNLDKNRLDPQPLLYDAAFTTQPDQACVVMSADCLPLLLCGHDGKMIAAVHCGWRSLAAGIIQKTIEAMNTTGLMAWLGPAIGPDAFEVGDLMRQCFTEPGDGAAFRAGGERDVAERYYANIYALARSRLIKAGVKFQDIYQNFDPKYSCTYSNPTDFYSYRRDNVTGRMATVICIKAR